PPRHHSLETSINWSYEQITRAGQALLWRLASLPDRWTLRDAESATDAGSRVDVLATVLELIDKGLIVTVPVGDETRFVVLQTVRAYVAQLRSNPDDVSHMAPSVAADDLLSLREPAMWPGRPAA